MKSERSANGLTVGRFGKKHGLSRSALLYYDRIGLLRPSGRSTSGYRVYSEQDAARLDSIMRYRAVGLGLSEIKEVLSARGRTAEILETRLEALNVEMSALREQQRVIVRLLGNHEQLRRTRAMDKERWVRILRATGLDDDDMHRWHVEFERTAPEAHRDFLESLGLGPDDVSRIRDRAK